jgi:exopolysaccharide biosynthesis predicted pyruvyltransferase EpsI
MAGFDVFQAEVCDALEKLNAETIAAFDWLTEGVGRETPVTFVPNHGNIGDAAINLGCIGYLNGRFRTVEVRAMTELPRTECVFVGGGGNAVEPLYNSLRDFLDRLPSGHRLFMFPATVRGYRQSFRRVAPIARILCRERVSHAQLAEQIGAERVALAHDAAFLLAPQLQNYFKRRMAKTRTAKCRSFRNDCERNHSETGGADIMGQERSQWTDMKFAHDKVWANARYLLDFGEVETDRLHCAILAAMLGRRTVLRANSYYKNAAVFEHSLSRLSNVSFVPATDLVTA